LREVSTARNFGLSPRLVPPIRLRPSFGLKPRAPQSAAWNGLVTVNGWSSPAEAKLSPEPRTVLAVDVREQLVGLRTKPGRST
jgi:hypothetical protein